MVANFPKAGLEKGNWGRDNWGSIGRLLLNPICSPESHPTLKYTMTDFYEPESVKLYSKFKFSCIPQEERESTCLMLLSLGRT